MKKKFSKKQIAFVLVAICLVGLIGIGVSYSYYLANISTSNEENKNSDISSATITKVVMDMQGKVTSDGTYPGHKMVKEVVVRGIGESNSLPANASIQITPDLGDFSDDVTWKLYKSEEAITCSSTLHKEGNIYEESTCNIPSSATLELKGTADNAYKNIVVKPNTETKYYLVVEYLNKTDINQSNQMGKSFSIDIGIGEKQATPLEKIIASVDTTGKCPTINSDETVNVTKIEATDGYVCSASDVYGTSYYYRGNVTNNYVKFGKWSDDAPSVVYGYYSETSDEYYIEYDSMEACQNASRYNKNCTIINRAGKDMYWRMVRINGDGTVRVIYDGTSAHTNGESNIDRQIGTSTFNTYWKKDNIQEATNSPVYIDNAGVGYMYGNRDAIVEAIEYYSTTRFTNTNTYYIAKEYNYDATTDRFTLKDPIAVLGSAMTSDYVGYYTFGSTSVTSSNSAYRIFRITAGDTYATVGYGYVRYGTSSKEVAQTNTNDSTIKTYLDNWYKTNISGTENEQYLTDNIFCNDRSFSSSNTGTGAGTSHTKYHWYDFYTSANKSNLKCTQQNDAFTVSDTTNGNGALTYPIGLITTDEAVLAGGLDDENRGYYLYSGSWYWASAPIDFDGDSRVRDVNYDGYAYNSYITDYTGGVRPVLNISPEVLNKGDGTMNNPYRIE